MHARETSVICADYPLSGGSRAVALGGCEGGGREDADDGGVREARVARRKKKANSALRAG